VYLTDVSLPCGVILIVQKENKKTGLLNSYQIPFFSSDNRHFLTNSVNSKFLGMLKRNEILISLEWSLSFEKSLSSSEYINSVSFLKDLERKNCLLKTHRKSV
jgi:hypothetical protein